jgi:hypothetical protein
MMSVGGFVFFIAILLCFLGEHLVSFENSTPKHFVLGVVN